MKKYLLILLPIITITAGQTFSKLGVEQLKLDNRVINIFIVSGYFLIIFRSLVWIWVLRRVKLSVAYPFISFTYILVLLISFFFFDEPITTKQILGSSLLVLGIFFVGYGEFKNRKSGL